MTLKYNVDNCYKSDNSNESLIPPSRPWVSWGTGWVIVGGYGALAADPHSLQSVFLVSGPRFSESGYHGAREIRQPSQIQTSFIPALIGKFTEPRGGW